MIKKVFPILAFAMFASVLGIGIIVPLLPVYTETLGASSLELGIIMASFSISNAVAIPFFGRLSDKRGRKAIILIGLMFYALTAFALMWAHSVIVLSAIRLLQGVAGGMIFPTVQAYVGDISPEGEEGTWMGYANAAFFTGFGVGPLMGGALTEQFGMTLAFVVMGALLLLAFLVTLMFLPESPARKTVPTRSPSFLPIGRSSTMKGIFSQRISFAFGRGVFNTFVPVFAAFSLGLNPGAVGLILAANLLSMSILQVGGGRLADRFNRKKLVIVGGVVDFLYLGLIPLAHSFPVLLALSFFGSLGGAIATPAASALNVLEGRACGMGAAIAVFSVGFSVGFMLGPVLSGALVDFTSSINTAFYCGALVSLIGVGLFSWLTRQTAIKSPA